ncbi:DALR anticodon-binding domain-containing protein 3-like [Aphidius gifuensis]|uniref:DALR anticodon-binding domain-containing protein 3-like n=1 Tax=Aphidius gifuensis TaxID=684658 RepID=UPI001CDD3D5A|nr:DALR anticodon-binding domain-containing protein 3-like [Aphidius gifuensis]
MYLVLTNKVIGKIENTKIIKLHNENLQTIGELSFPINFSAWKNLVDIEESSKEPQNILEYYLQRVGKDTINLSLKEIEHQALELIKLASNDKSWTISKICLIKNRVCIFIDRTTIISSIIKQVIKENKSFGKDINKNTSISIKINEDFESNITTARLKELKNFTENILKIQGYKITIDNAQLKVLLSSKSQVKIDDDDVKIIVCGVVKNYKTQSKEISLNFDTYLNEKLDEVRELNNARMSESITEISNQDELRLTTIARSILIFELLGFRPSRSVVLGGNKEEENPNCRIKAGAFVLYNVARIETILRTFKERQASGLYPDNFNIDDVDFGILQSEQEWNLIWNFILGYKETLLNSVNYTGENLELCPQNFISFLSNWSYQFSVYYHRTRILTDGNKNLTSSMLVRIYLLKSFLIIINNALETMGLATVSSM